jgi:hypothetical protein
LYYYYGDSPLNGLLKEQLVDCTYISSRDGCGGRGWMDEAYTLIGHGGTVYAFANLPNGNLASGSYDNTVRR